MIFSFNLTTKTAACNSNLDMVKEFCFNGARRDFAERKVHFMILVLLLLTFTYTTAPYTSFDASENIMSSVLQSSPSQ